MNKKNGLIFGYVLDGKGGGTEVDWDGVKPWTPEKGTLWVHLDYTAEEVQQWLEAESSLSEISRDLLTEKDTRPRFVSSKEGLFLILRVVNCNPGADPEDMVALRMCFNENRIITMRQRRVMALDDIHRAIESGNGPGGPSDFLATVNERIGDRMGDVVTQADDRMDELEDTVLTAESHALRPMLADLRRRCISLRRYIAPQRDVLSRLVSERIAWISDKDKLRLREVAERTARFVEDIDSARDRAAITQEELNNRLSEQMNKAMYLLSIVAAIFLPLGLISGLLGINVGGIPGAEYHLAFYSVALFMLLIALVLVLLFKRLKWL
ncbi:MAG: zinc transporter ZntB [Desulfobacterales bacterium]|nr:zinc transporter ZntB [Desulfobacterales bacterium]